MPVLEASENLDAVKVASSNMTMKKGQSKGYVKQLERMARPPRPKPKRMPSAFDNPDYDPDKAREYLESKGIQVIDRREKKN